MTRFLLPAGVVILVVVIFVGGRFILSSSSVGLTSPKEATQSPAQNSATPGTSSPSGTLEQRIAELEFSVSDLLKQVRGVTPSSSSTTVSSDTEKRVKTLETSMADLVNRVIALEQKNTTATTSQTATSKAPSYIPLGWVGSSVNTNWASISGQEFTINTADYPGYISMQFEVSLRIFQNGQAFARLEVKDAGTSILASEVSTTSQSYTWLSSSTFQLPAGSKTYRLQLKSLTGYSADVQNARIKVNF